RSRHAHDLPGAEERQAVCCHCGRRWRCVQPENFRRAGCLCLTCGVVALCALRLVPGREYSGSRSDPWLTQDGHDSPSAARVLPPSYSSEPSIRQENPFHLPRERCRCERWFLLRPEPW